MRLKNSGEATTDETHRVYLSGKDENYQYGVVFLVHKDIVSSLSTEADLLPFAGRHPFYNSTIKQVYVATSNDDDNLLEELYNV